MNSQKLRNIINGINKRCLQKDRKCFVEGCEKSSIMSHALQKNGILNKISNNEHVYQIQLLHYPKTHYSIERVGLNKAFTFKGFCQNHDTLLFKEIESKKLELTDYSSLLLYSYRAILKEYREKEVMIDLYNRIIKSSNVGQFFNLKDVQDYVDAETYLLWDLEYLMVEINNDLRKGTQSFNFEYFKISKIDICASAVYSLKSIAHTFNDDDFYGINKRLIPCIIVNIFPIDNETLIILGYSKQSEEFCQPEVERIVNNNEDIYKSISDLLIRYFATWCCSEDFYNKNIKERKNRVIELLNYFTKRNQFSKEEIYLNLFG